MYDGKGKNENSRGIINMLMDGSNIICGTLVITKEVIDSPFYKNKPINQLVIITCIRADVKLWVDVWVFL